MITHDDVVAAHEQSYRVMRTGRWHLRVGLAALIFGIAPVVIYALLLMIAWGTGRAAERVAVDTELLVGSAIFACLAVGGFVQRRAGTVMHAVTGTRHAVRVRRACGVGAIGALCSSAPVLFILGAAALDVTRGGSPALGACGMLCAAPLFVPLYLLFESGRLWLRYPVAVDTILEGRIALQAQPRAPRIPPPLPELPPIDVDVDVDADAPPGSRPG